MWRIKINDITGFDLALSAGLSRSGTQVRTTVRAANNGADDVTNVRIVGATVRLEGVSTAINTSTALPVLINATLVPGDSGTGEVVFSHSSLLSGRFVNLTTTVQANANGGLKSITKTFRLRIP